MLLLWRFRESALPALGGSAGFALVGWGFALPACFGRLCGLYLGCCGPLWVMGGAIKPRQQPFFILVCGFRVQLRAWVDLGLCWQGFGGSGLDGALCGLGLWVESALPALGGGWGGGSICCPACPA